MKWTTPAGRLVWRTWNHTEFVVYNSDSGDTHLLSHVAAVALQQLEITPLSVEELTTRVGEALPDEVHDRLAEEMRQLLHGLEELGLIERVA